MTTLIAYLTEHGDVVIGADGLQTCGDTRLSRSVAKWRKRDNDWWIANAGNPRSLDLVVARGALALPCDAFALCDRIRSILLEDGYEADEAPAGPTNLSDPWLFARYGEVWLCDACGNMTHAELGSALAVGSGGEYAMGAAYVAMEKGYNDTDVVRVALSAACRFDVWSGGDLFVHTIKGGGDA